MKHDWRLEHLKHNLHIQYGVFGPHGAKIICKDCGDKFLSWLPKQYEMKNPPPNITVPAKPKLLKKLFYYRPSPRASIQSSIEWNSRLKQNEYTTRRITFGIHSGKMIKDIPMDYIKWGIMNLDTTWATYFSRELQRREPKWRDLK